MLKIRLRQCGRKQRRCYRIVVLDSRKKRDGAYIEKLGSYWPLEKQQSKQFEINLDRFAYWVSCGAKPTEIVSSIRNKLLAENKEATA